METGYLVPWYSAVYLQWFGIAQCDKGDVGIDYTLTGFILVKQHGEGWQSGTTPGRLICFVSGAGFGER